MKRFAEIDLKNWFYGHDRHPLIIRGARLIGKSTLVKLFAQAEGLSLFEINLEKMQLTSVKSREFKMQFLLDEIQLKTKTRI